MSLAAQLLTLPKVFDPRGSLSFLEAGKNVPFAIRRTYWIFDVPGGETRGSHAFKNSHELIVALSGSFHVELHDGERPQSFVLDRSYKGVYVPPLQWRTLTNFSTNSVALVLSSSDYDEEDYIRDFSQYVRIRKTR